MYINKKHKNIVNKLGDIYIGTYCNNEILADSGKHNKGSKYIRIKCGYCGYIYDKRYDYKPSIKTCSHCCNFYENSFAYYLECELGLNLYDVWDFDKNILNPYHIYKSSNKKVWIKCLSEEVNPINGLMKKSYHESYDIRCSDFIHGDRCPYCSIKGNDRIPHPWDSFMYWAINVIDEDFENKYVSKNNKTNLWEHSIQSKIKAEFMCQKVEYHDNYTSSLLDFYRKYKDGTHYNCPQCSGKSGKIHHNDSYGTLYPDKAKYWSPKNKKSPFEVSPYSSSIKYWHICEKCGKEFKRAMCKINKNNYETLVLCSECASKSTLEIKTLDIFDKYSVNYEYQKEFNGLIGLGGGNLSYDFYLPDYNILLEDQGEQHEKHCPGLQPTYEDFLKQQEHDKRKFEYAINNNYIPMEIWYWDYDNIEEILIRELELIQ